ncbi:ABC transporter ATP-binding protein [Actinosynnema sp. NPDC047251]|uniref:Fe(3+) dicitrate transport ATP-binding protein n=1 Tax=Saccharothrix espanaensis (strain ATCC 51144 / DSM 44229 / JCM 9112 / NBRC 15066 / NRRL 15764) TaxID=1179773 RepID=K0JZB7_SACES|nr:ABC transporter ATP-binding protein [Saccharothrix espanaensis]CCH30602.1 Fe(3+) dicitrate transport ATP-binding protein [Saccharothrix espanaensis DSM 44229]
MTPLLSPLRAEGVRVRFGDNEVLKGVDLAVGAGEWLSLLGQNGSGKTTLLRVLAGLLEPSRGAVLLDGGPLEALSRRDIARRIALLPQTTPYVHGLTVRQFVRQGRYAARGPLGMLGESDDEQVRAALRDTGVAEWADTPLERLSGGQRQRVRLALALAQDAPVLLLDEPTTFLDIRHQIDVLNLVRALQRERGLTVVAVLHDLAQAARYSDRVVALREGVVHADGAPSEVVDAALLREVYGVAGEVLWITTNGVLKMVVVPD